MIDAAAKIDTQRMLDTATAFFLAGERNKLYARLNDYDFHSLAAPTLTNFALSAEVALKLLVFIDQGKIAHGHKISKIFGELSESTKEKLAHTDANLDELDDCFVDWRYSYEKEFLAGSDDCPRRAFIETYREIRLLRPDLKSVYEKNWGSFAPDWIEVPVSIDPKFEIRLVAPND